jgi:hypothetical protein
VQLGIVIDKDLQTLVWWVHDRQKRCLLALHAADFDANTLAEGAVVMKDLYKERADKHQPSVTALGKFDPDDFDTHEDVFLNLMSQTFGVLKEPLCYVVRPATILTAFGSGDEEARMYQFPLEGPAFQMDNMTVYQKLKAFLIDSPGWAWIEHHDMAENERAAFLAWIAHYDGEGELSKRTALAKAKLETLHYKSEQSLSFERCTEIMTKCFHTLHKDPDQRYSERRKVEKLPIRNLPRRKSSRKAYMETTSPTPVATFHSKFQESTHQLSWSTDEANPVSAAFMPLIVRQAVADGDEAAMEDAMAAEVDEVNDNGGRGWRNNINGVNITDPHRSFTRNEWDTLGPEGRTSPPCYLCENALRKEAAAARVVDVMEAAEDEFASRTATMNAISARHSSNTMPMHLPQPKKTKLSRIAEDETAMAFLAAAPMDDKDEVDIDSLGHWLRF